MTARELGMLLLLAGIWGASYLFIRVASPVFGPFVLMEARVALAGTILLAYALLTGRAPELSSRWRRYLVLGTLSGALPFALIAVSELYIPASLAAILNATTPLFSVLVAAAWGQETLTRPRLVGVLLGMVGVGVLVGWSSLGINGTVVFAIVASLFAALAYALGGSYAGRTFAGVPSLSVAIGQQFGAAVVLLPFAVVALPRAHASGDALANLLALAVLSTAVAYLIYYPLLRSAGPTGALSVTFLIPVFGLLWGAVFLHERIGSGTLAGLLIILLSVGLVTNVRLRPAARKATQAA